MARISSYPLDREITANDNWIGSSSPGQQTRNFSAGSVAEYIITDYAFGINMKFLFTTYILPAHCFWTGIIQSF